MITFNFTGSIFALGELKEGYKRDGSTWRRIDVVCEVPDGRFTDKIAFTAMDGNADILAGCREGDEISVEGYIYAREWNDRYYNNLQASKVSPLRQPIAQPAAAATAPAPTAPAVHDDLPF